MASRASQLGALDLTDPEKAKVWLIAFAALARAQGWVDVPAENAETDDKLTITDNFIASCGIDALLKIRFIVAPDEIEKLQFTTIKENILNYLKPKSRLVIAERTRFYGIRQNPNETVADYVTRLRQESQYCDFDSLKTCRDPTKRC